MSGPHSHGFSRFPTGRLALVFVIIAVATLSFTLPALALYFSGDDLANLGYYRERPFLTFVSNLTFWSSFRRPLGGALYLILYQVFGMTPVVYYLTGLLIFYLNLALLLYFLWRLTGEYWIAAVGGVVATLHPQHHNIWYNFGAVYELLACAFMLASFIFYLWFRESGSWRRYYLPALACFLLALNSKEMAVTLPVLLFCYELIYRNLFQSRPSISPAILPIFPFALISGVYTIGKVLGEEAFWRDNPLYRFYFDLTIYHNLHAYLDITLYNLFHFNDAKLAWTIAGTLILALALKSRHLLFGWSFFWLSFMPVLPLPRVWGLFLYIPLIGFAIYVGGLVFEFISRVSAFLPQQKNRWAVSAVGWVGFVVITAGLYLKISHEIPMVYATHYLNPRQEWALFARHLVEQKPQASSESMFLFENDPAEQWYLHFIVWLTYDNFDIRVLRAPDDVARFLKLRDLYPDTVILRWDGTELKRLSDLSQLQSSPP
ncbi:MAG TPA: hypothetical protein VKZ59_08180 [Acidobacteriota bacterium]|nr:hypothetical protein [Acidobacteriota bacterium]